MSANTGPTIAPVYYSGLNVGTSQYNAALPIFWGQVRLSFYVLWYGDFSRVAVNNGKGGNTKGGLQQYNYSAAVIVALCEGPLDGIRRGFPSGSTTTTATLAAFNMTLFSGTASQSPWSWLASYDPAQSRAYAYTAYLATPKIGLGESATVPDRAFESMRSLSFAYVPTSPGWINPTTHNQDGVSGPFAGDPAIDCLMSDIIPDLLTNVQYGQFLESGDIGDTTQFAAYQRAQGLHFSPLLNSQEKVNAILDRWAPLCNAWIYWSGTQLQFVPLGDVAITANGVTYTPVTDVLYDLTPADFIAEDEGPIKVTRKDWADCYSRLVLSIKDRTRGYISIPFEWKSDYLTGKIGLRDDSSTQSDEICDPLVGPVAVQLMGKRGAYIRKTYEFKVAHPKFVLCLPGSILTLTEPHAALSTERVRVKTISESAEGQFSFVCEEYPGNVGVYVPPIANNPAIPNNFPDTLATPPSVNTPAVAEPNSSFTGGVAKLLVAASGGANWGGCDVLLSLDAVTYINIGTIIAPATQGLLTANLAAYGGSNPDNTNTLSVDCTESALIPPATASSVQAAALQTLSLVSAQPGMGSILATSGELLAFGAATPTGTYAADLTDMYRGEYGTSAGSHSIGDQFTMFDLSGQDGTTLEYTLQASYIGKTLYLKFPSFNLFQQQQQDPSICVEYIYIPIGMGFGSGTAGVPATPTGLALVGSAGATSATLGWSANASTDNVTAYVLSRAPGTGASFGSSAVVWTGLSLSDLDSGLASVTGYTYFLQAKNAVGLSSATAGVNVTTSASTGSATTAEIVTTSTLTLGTPPALTWYVNVNNTSGGAINIKLPPPTINQVVKITDVTGNAGTHAFTIQDSGGGALTPPASISANYGSLTIHGDGSVWIQ